jgi:hypothetical protein
VGPCPAESATGPMEKMPHRSDCQTWRRIAEHPVGSCYLAHNRSRNEYDTGSTETDNLQSTDETESIASAYGSGEIHLSIARPSEQILALITVSASSLSDAGEDGPVIIDVSKLTTVKILDKRLSSSGVEYKCELEPLWLAADMAERAQMGRVSHPELRERTCTRQTAQNIEGGKAKVSRNVSVLRG